MKLRPKVLKYGGSAVKDPQRLGVVAQDVIDEARSGQGVVVVVSAMGDETDDLLRFMADINPSASRAAVDMVVQTGEVKAVGALQAAIERHGGKVVAFTSQQVGFLGTDEDGSALLLQVRGVSRIRKALAEESIVVVPGFQAVDRDGRLITLGRGGSDLTAVALAVRLSAAWCIFKKDVDGLSPVDPRLVQDAIIFGELDYGEARTVSQNRVLMDRAIKLAQAHLVSLKVMCSPSIGPSTGGTIIRRASTHNRLEPEPRPITAISTAADLILVECLGVLDRPGQAARILEALGDISMSDLVQGAATRKRATVSFLVRAARLSEAIARIRPVHRRLRVRRGYVGLTVIDERMREDPRYGARIARAAARVGTNIALVSSSGSSITVGISANQLSRTTHSLADEFGLRRKAA